MLRRFLTCGVAVAALVAPSAITSAQSPRPVLSGPAPVTIAACEITRRPRYRNRTSPYPVPVTGGLHVGFVNHGAIAAKEIRFRVDYRGESEVIIYGGTFTPGALISHSFDNFSDYAYLGPTPNLCEVIIVRFADGTVWNGVARGQLRRPL
jgi:hypothetical protein